MATTLVNLYNLALMRMGSTELLAATTEAKISAQLLNEYYEHCRDFVLRDYPWRFAKRRVQLAVRVAATVAATTAWAQSTPYVAGDFRSNGGYNYACAISHTSTSSFATDLAAGKWTLYNIIGEIVAPDNWAYAYTLPTDCLLVRSLMPYGVRNPIANMRTPFEIGNDGTTTVIYTDLEDASLVYTARVTDITLFDTYFISALAFNLAAEIAMPLRAKPDVSQVMMQMYGKVVQEAAARDMSQGWDETPDQSFMSARERNG